MIDGTKSQDRNLRRQIACRGVCHRLIRCFGALLVTATAVSAAPASAQKVRIDGLVDVNFGTIANLTADSWQSQSICVFSQTANGGYNIRAFGSGTGGSFTLASGGNTLAYEVQWSATSGQTTGTILTANTALTGLTSAATQQVCNAGPPTTASLIVVLRAAALTSAIAGAYSGTLTLVVAPE
ncbi:MAG: hypothetical protein ABIO43_03350 [Sphingomicrobium sp.]